MINPELNAFLAAWADGWSTLPPGSSPAARRAHFEVVAARMRQPMPDGVTTQERWIERDGRRVRVRSFRVPAASPQRSMIYLHGGAFMQGSPETHWDITSSIAGTAVEAPGEAPSSPAIDPSAAASTVVPNSSTPSFLESRRIT